MFRRASHEDAATLAFLHLSCFPTQPWSEQSFLELLRLPTTRIFLASEHHTPIGFVVFQATLDEAELLSLGVLPEYRRMHTAIRLMEHGLQMLAGEGVSSVFLEVAPSNRIAKALYTNLGFSHLRTRKHYYTHPDGSREDAYIWKKLLR